MPELLTMQDLANGHLDVKALGEAANGDENTIVTTRTGNTYPSAERAIKTMFQNGGLPATQFDTYLQMIGSSVADGAIAVVTHDDDVAANGYYKKTVTGWEYQNINSIQRLMAVEDKASKLASFINEAKTIEMTENALTAQGNRTVSQLEGWHIVGLYLEQGDLLQCDKVYLKTFYIEDIVDNDHPNSLLSRFPTPATPEGYKAEYAGKVWFSLPINEKVYVNGQLRDTPVTQTGVYWENRRLIPHGDFRSTLNAVRVLKGDRLTFKSPLAGSILVVFKGDNDTDFHNALGTLYRNNTYVSPDLEWTAPEDGWAHVCSHKDKPVYHYSKANELPADNLTAYVDKRIREGSNSSVVPANLTLPAIEYVFATAMNYILKTEVIEGANYIKISQDLGKTWTQIPNILGDIVAYHFFSDGTIMLCSPQKVYWTDDYLTLNEATVYDHDGSVFVPTSRHFFAMQTGDKLDFVGDTEIHSWGDYHVDGTPARIWYTTDNGRTIKCSARFGVTDMGGVVRSIRHIHRVYYHQKTDYWYVTTGDFGDECMIIRGRYNPTTDVWAWEVLNSGIYYKFGNIMIDDDNMAFMITDYTEASQAEEKGIYRVHASNLGDFSKYRRIYKAEPSEWGAIAPVSLLLDPNGNKVILPDYLGAGYIWVASEGLNFKRVTISPNILLTYTLGENYNGDIYCVAYEGGNNLRLSSGSYNLTKALRNAGMSNFMRGSTLITGLKTVVS